MQTQLDRVLLMRLYLVLLAHPARLGFRQQSLSSSEHARLVALVAQLVDDSLKTYVDTLDVAVNFLKLVPRPDNRETCGLLQFHSETPSTHRSPRWHDA